jgi:mono/diheme cytochrome c family protein
VIPNAVAWCALAVCLGVTVSISAATELQAAAAPIPAPRVNYLERCGGCHGLEGVSARRDVPTLRGQAGYFLCTPEGRRYVIQLPNVARVALDDEEVAAMMNYVVFELGGGSPSRYAPYTPAEVAGLRQQPLVTVSLSALRAKLVDQLIGSCTAPAALRDYSGPWSSSSTK